MSTTDIAYLDVVTGFSLARKALCILNGNHGRVCRDGGALKVIILN